ncbi:MAG: hypothetical protein H6608_01875 [Flavobacteriales bacterium]|nr:hypothetical protein [Flavobacteriales bacterium]
MNRQLHVFTMGGRKTGFGHVARILPIIQAFEANDIEVEIHVDGDDAVEALLSPRNIYINDWPNESCPTLQSSDIVLIDTLTFPASFVQSAQSQTPQVYFVSDANDSNELPVHVLNWRLKAEFDAPNRAYTGITGAKYVPVRSELLSCQKPVEQRKKEVVISMGSGDVLNLIPSTIDYCLDYLSNNYCIKAIVRSYHPQFKELENLQSERVELIVDVSSDVLFEKMSTCEFAIASGGHSIYEFAYLGIPVVHVLIAENQKPAQCWNETGFTYPLNQYDEKTYANKLKAGVEYFIDNDRRIQSAIIGMQLIDGNGAIRTAKALME